MDLIQGQFPEGVEFGGGRRKSREGRRATGGLTDGFNLLNEKVQKTLGRWTPCDGRHSIQPHDGGEGPPQLTRLARVFRNTGQPVAVLLETIVVGIVGAIANGVVMLIFLTQTKKTKLTTSSKFVINHLCLDLFSCLSVVITYGWKIANRKLETNWNYWTCYLIGSETLLWCGVNSSVTNLVVLTLERYSKIVHTSMHQTYYRNWMTYVLLASSWFLGFLVVAPTNFVSFSYHRDGFAVTCDGFANWTNVYVGLFFGIFVFFFNYANPMLVFIVCYWRIILAIRKSATFFSRSNSGVNQMHHRNEVALVKTMIIITTLFGNMLVAK